MSPQSAHETLLDGEIQIYVREGNKNATYQVRFANIQDESKRYVRASLKTSNRSLAIERAIAKYREHHSRAFLGLKTDCVSIEDLMDKAIGKLNKDTAKTAQSMYRAYWSVYMEGQDLSRWKTSDIEEYFKWRIQKGINKTDSKWKASKNSISLTTLLLEKSLLQTLFQSGFQQSLIAKVPTFPSHLENFKGVHKLSPHKRRGRFTDIQYQTVSRDFGSIRSTLNNISLQPSLDSDSNEFVSWAAATGHKSSLSIPEDRRWAVKKRSRFSRAQYWFACILIANTGIRPVELVKLKHSDISLKRSKADGALYTVINVSSTVSKVNKFRDVIAQDLHLSFERYLDYKRELKFIFNAEPSPEDWLFPQQNNYEQPVKHLHNIVRPNLQRIGLHRHFDKENKGVETFFSAYSFRAYYITKRLQNGLNIYTLAKNCGVSIQTLSSTYDYNENWAFRDQMTQHLGKWSPGENTNTDLDKYAEPWK